MVPTFDLIDVIRIIQKKFKFIVLIGVACMVVATVFNFAKKKKYKAAAKFLVSNPLYVDRSTIFRNIETRYVDYFGGDDDLDRATALLNSDTVRDRIIRNCQFQDVYHSDINSNEGHAFLMQVFNKNFNVKRSEYKDIEVSYIAYDSMTAANVANMSVAVLTESYRKIFLDEKVGMAKALEDKIKELDTAIAKYTDSLVALRGTYGVTGIVSPNRQNMIGEGASHANSAAGLELVQNVESIKDQLVIDRAHYISLKNEFTTTMNPSMPFIKVISRAVPPAGPSGPSIMVLLIGSGAVGAFFACIYVLIAAYYKMLNSVVR